MFKQVFKRFAKGAGAVILAGMASHATPICDLLVSFVPANVLTALNIIGQNVSTLCTAGLAGLILAVEKAINFNKGGNTNV